MTRQNYINILIAIAQTYRKIEEFYLDKNFVALANSAEITADDFTDSAASVAIFKSYVVSKEELARAKQILENAKSRLTKIQAA